MGILILVSVFQLTLAFLVGYLLLLTAAAWRSARSTTPSNPKKTHRFAILIPAHNEEHLLPALLESLEKLDFPNDQFRVHIVADNCTDRTAAVALQKGAQVYVRTDHNHLGKGAALNWLINCLRAEHELDDAVVFLDADSIVSTNFLQVMSAHFERGECAIQAFYTVRDPDLSWAGSLRYAALAVLHFLRPLGRMYLGTSAGLKGNGMALSADLVQGDTWSSSITEDIELHMSLLLSGQRVTFAPDAVVWGEMPDTLDNSVSQHLRWEHGKKQLARKYLPKLLAGALRKLFSGQPRIAFVLFDAAMEFIEPPFSILFGASLVNLLVCLVLVASLPVAPSLSSLPGLVRLAALNLLFAIVLLLGQGVYLAAGLRFVSAPKQVYHSLLYTPRLVLWKSWQMVLVLLSKNQNSWVRTNRNRG